jgi:hypothetical protein
LKDALDASILTDLNGRAWRIIADAKEAMGDIQGAMEAVILWAEKNPSFSAKAKKELDRLSKNLY